MPLDTTPSTVATNALQSIPFSAMIGGPLDAAIKAQALAAQTSWEFIQNVGLYKDQTTGEAKAVSVNFQYQKNGEMVNLIVPLLAIVPIPYIAIDTITIDFMAKIDASASTVSEQATEKEGNFKGSADMSLGWGPFSAKVHMEGGYSSKSSSKATQESKYSVEYTLNIHVEAGQDSMPAGLATVLNILNSAITEGNPNGTFDISPGSATLSEDSPDQVQTITVKARNANDMGVTTQIDFTLEDGLASGDVELGEVVIGSAVSGGSGLASVTPNEQGIAAITIKLPAGSALTDNKTGKVTATQDTKTASTKLTLQKKSA